jgi:dolichyl-phosphate beta-glucosyltransferase
MTSDVRLSVVVPAFNEEERLPATLARIRGYLEERAIASEIIVVDDGSSDRTARAAAEALRGRPNDLVLRLAKNRGKGRAVREGVLASKGRFVLYTDADLSTPIGDIEKFFPVMEGGADVVIGSRAHPQAEIQVHQNPLREFLGKTFNVFVRALILQGFRDTQCGFKLFRGDAAREVFRLVRTDGFSFDVEALFIARRLGFRVAEVPVVWCDSRPSKVRLVGSSLRMLGDLLRIRPRHRRTAPGKDGRKSRST